MYKGVNGVKLGDIYKSSDDKYYMVTGFHTWSDTNLGRVAYVQTLHSGISERTINFLLNHCSLQSRIDE